MMTVVELEVVGARVNYFKDAVRYYRKMQKLTSVSLYFDGYNSEMLYDNESLSELRKHLVDRAASLVRATAVDLVSRGVDPVAEIPEELR